MAVHPDIDCQIWMGSLEPYMSEPYIMNIFRACGEDPTRVKIMRDKHSTTSSGYCFVQFETEEVARLVLHKLNGKIIPNTNPPVKFKLNYAGVGAKANATPENEFALYMGDLSPEVDDYTLYKCLSARYRSLKSAKVVYDPNGISKGYAFVRFVSEADQKRCITEMNGFVGLGSKPIKVGAAAPRVYFKKDTPPAPINNTNTTVVPTYDYTQSYYSSAAAWQNYSWQSNYYYQQSLLAYTSFYPAQTYEGNDDMELIGECGELWPSL